MIRCRVCGKKEPHWSALVTHMEVGHDITVNVSAVLSDRECDDREDDKSALPPGLSPRDPRRRDECA